MKKKFLRFVLATCLILSCAFMLTACGEDGDKNFNVNVRTFKNGVQTALQDGVKEIRLVDVTNLSNNYILSGFPVGENLGMEEKQFEVKKGTKLVLLVTLKPGYEINDVTIKADGYNGEEIAPEEAFTESPQDDWIYSFVVTESLNKELWIVFDGAPAKRTQTITLTQSNVDRFNQADPEFLDNLPASVVLANARFSLSYVDEQFPVGCPVLDNVNLNELKAKLDENFSFEVKSGATFTLVVTPNYTSQYGDRCLLDFSGISLGDFFSSFQHQIFKKESTSATITTFDDMNINFDWSLMAFFDMRNAVDIMLRFNDIQQGFDVKTSDGSLLRSGDTGVYLPLDDYFDNISDGIKLETAIDSTTFATLLTSSLTFDNGASYISFVDAISEGIVSVDSESNPTTLTVSLQDARKEVKGWLQININFAFRDN